MRLLMSLHTGPAKEAVFVSEPMPASGNTEDDDRIQFQAPLTFGLTR